VPTSLIITGILYRIGCLAALVTPNPDSKRTGKRSWKKQKEWKMVKSKYNGMKIGRIAQTYLVDALQNGSFSSTEIQNMLDKSYSRKTFGLGYSLLSEDRRIDNKGRPRDYAKPLTIGGKQYFLCSQWLDKPARNKLITWLDNHGGAAEKTSGRTTVKNPAIEDTTSKRTASKKTQSITRIDTAIAKMWKNYNLVNNQIYEAMGGTANIVSEFAEKLVADYYKGEQLPASAKSADVLLKNGKKIQVKARKLRQETLATSLGIIRSWNFDYLVVVLFATDGTVIKALEMDVDTAKSVATPNKHQNGWVITTTKEFTEHPSSRDITGHLNRIIR